MDAFQQIALIFEEDCIARLSVLEAAQAVLERSETMGAAMRHINSHCEIYSEDCERLMAISPEIERLRSCIYATDVGVSFL